jgi:MATE family multidrug resistance protein
MCVSEVVDHECCSPASSSRYNNNNNIYLQELQQQLKTSLPTMLSMLLYRIPWLIIFWFVGRIGSDELAATALATTVCNVTGISLSVGLSTAMRTLTGQARGDTLLMRRQKQIHNEDEMSTLILTNNTNIPNYGSHLNSEDLSEGDEPLLTFVYLYRGIFIQCFLTIPVGAWWIYGIQPLLLALGQGETIAAMAQDYLRILAPAMWGFSVNWTITAWLQAIEMADIPLYFAAVGLCLHIWFNQLFIDTLDMGFLGAAMAIVASQVIKPLFMCMYLFGTHGGAARVMRHCCGDSTRTHIPFWKEASMSMSIPGILQYLSLALPGIVAVSEWWASEICIFLSGTLTPNPNLALDGMAIFQSINSMCHMLPFGCMVAGSTRVGNVLGSGDARGAAVAATVSVSSAAFVSVSLATIWCWTPHSLFPSLFSQDEHVVAQTSKLIPLLSTYVVADGIQAALDGVMSGCGRQCVVMPILVVAYWIVGVPLAYYLAFVSHKGLMCDDSLFCGVGGLVVGMTTGTYVHMVLLAIVVIFTTNFKREAVRAKKRMSLDRAQPKS